MPDGQGSRENNALKLIKKRVEKQRSIHRGGIMKKEFLTFFISVIPVVLIPFFSGCTHRPGDRSMGGWGHMMGYGGYGGIFMWILIIIIVAVILYFVINRGKTTGTLTGSEKESPSEILKKRYAKGEITKEEFDKQKKDIES